MFRALATAYLNTLLQCGNVYPYEPNEAWRRLKAELTAVNCMPSFTDAQNDVRMRAMGAVLADWNNGGYSDLGGPCACTDQWCQRNARAMEPESGADFAAIAENDDNVKHWMAIALHPTGVAIGTVLLALGAVMVLLTLAAGIAVLVVGRHRRRRLAAQGYRKHRSNVADDDDTDDSSGSVELPIVKAAGVTMGKAD
jgi:hypothetical protein